MFACDLFNFIYYRFSLHLYKLIEYLNAYIYIKLNFKKLKKVSFFFVKLIYLN